MLNVKHISEIIYKTIKNMGEKEPSIVKLIKGTFVCQSNLEKLYDHTNNYNKKHGLMLLDDNRLKFIFDELRYNPTLRDKIILATNGIDLLDWDFQSFGEELETNILLMVAVTFAFYQLKNSYIPDDNLRDIGKFYVKIFLESDDIKKIDEFAIKYKKTFVS